VFITGMGLVTLTVDVTANDNETLLAAGTVIAFHVSIFVPGSYTPPSFAEPAT
jgi:hypothetical protein